MLRIEKHVGEHFASWQLGFPLAKFVLRLSDGAEEVHSFVCLSGRIFRPRFYDIVFPFQVIGYVSFIPLACAIKQFVVMFQGVLRGGGIVEMTCGYGASPIGDELN